MTGRHTSPRRNGQYTESRVPRQKLNSESRFDEYGDEIERPGRADHGERYFATQPGTQAAAKALAAWIAERNRSK